MFVYGMCCGGGSAGGDIGTMGSAAGVAGNSPASFHPSIDKYIIGKIPTGRSFPWEDILLSAMLRVVAVRVLTHREG